MYTTRKPAVRFFSLRSIISYRRSLHRASRKELCICCLPCPFYQQMPLVIMSTPNTTVDPSLFKAYDVRGIYGETLTDDIAYRIGRAAAQYLNVPQIAVGRDMRLSSPQLAAAI